MRDPLMSDAPGFTLRLFGGAILLARGGEPVHGRATQRRRIILLSLLALDRTGWMTRDKLVGYLWPEAEESRARHLLSDSLYVLRKELGDQVVKTVGNDVHLNPGEVAVDVRAFHEALETGGLERAVELYTGPLLDGVYINGAPEFERWVDDQRRECLRRHCAALETLAERAEEAGELRAAVGWWRRLVAEQPACARVTRRLMRALDATGERAAALREAERHAAFLSDELGAEPDPEVMELARRLPKAPTRSGAAIPRPAIAVLPFADFTGDERNGRFCDGMMDEILTQLALGRGMAVVSRTSVQRYRRTTVPLPQIARQVGADYVLEGSVRRGDGRVRIIAQLIDGRKDHHVWAATYERNLSDVLEVQSDLARRIAGAVGMTLSPDPASPDGESASPADAYLNDLAIRLGLPRPVGVESPDPFLGRRFGSYRVLRLVGRGGMGAVYLAERADGLFERQVAIKLLPLALASEVARRRFDLERRILAGLDHRNIAPLLDGGTTGEGVPYLVLEYVEGRSIDRHCQDLGLALDARLELLCQVCDAVAHAHEQGVVHRDLKPSNVLVDSRGQVKLLDFGIARLLEEPDHDTTTLTRAGGRPLTPRYASPEQLKGDPISPATDIYALGVLLYELMTGEAPYDLSGLTTREILEQLESEDPVPPSRRGRAAGAGDAVLDGRFWSRLDAVTTRAIDPAPARRCASAGSLADDLRRCRQGQSPAVPLSRVSTRSLAAPEVLRSRAAAGPRR